jgi:hypothetical protein
VGDETRGEAYNGNENGEWKRKRKKMHDGRFGEVGMIYGARFYASDLAAWGRSIQCILDKQNRKVQFVD